MSTELEDEETRREMDAVEMASGAYKISKEKENKTRSAGKTL